MRSVDGAAGSLCQAGSTNCMTSNAFGQVVEEKGADFDWVYLYGAGGEKIAWWNGTSNGWQRHLIYAAGREIRITDQPYYYHRNHIGSGTMMTDQTGAAIGERLYYPWGDRWAAAGAWVTPSFASLTDPVVGTGDIYPTQFRHYFPTTFRWMTPDPLAGDISNPQSLNRYAYVMNNPMNMIDPLGLAGECGPGRSSCEPWTRHTGKPPGSYVGGGFMPWHIPGYTDLDLQTKFGLIRLGPAALCEAGYATCEQYGQGVVGFDTVGNASYHWEAASWNLSRADSATLEEMGWRTSDPIQLSAPDARTQLEKLKKGFYFNPIDQVVNRHHKGEWTFREVFGTVCSEHRTVNMVTGKESAHRDTVNPVPGYPALFAAPLTFSIWTVNSVSHYVLDVKGLYPGETACK
jgi:RHS repeat-associated protein